MYLESSVLFVYFLSLNVALCCENLYLYLYLKSQWLFRKLHTCSAVLQSYHLSPKFFAVSRRPANSLWKKDNGNHNIKQSSVFIKILKSNNTRFFRKANSTLLAWSAKRKPKDPKKSNNTRQKRLTWLVQRDVGHGEVLNYHYNQQRVWLPCEQSLLTSIWSCTLRYCVFSMY